ncbi:YIP1 family protein [Massilia sp. CF038]|uniref:YIP1 family protein n=1 Tax=Massilia sp. CF038 TaxID=1881045 RepID=UPI00092181FD|nr:YIP1 family protein [Massilia sp. CF038]SHH44584.1 Yip1 domain-containing protein [Massilia sp. CF038]
MEMTKTADMPGNSPLSAVTSMFYEPSRAFAMLSPRRYGWLPLLLIVACSLIVMVWYFTAVDFPWLREQMVANMPATERDAAANMMSKGILMGGSIFGVLVGTPIIMAIMGVYFMLVSKVTNKEFTFNDGFSLATWSSIPTILSLPLAAIQILMSSNGQLTFSDLNPLSLNQLIFHYEFGSSMAGVMDAISLPMLWSIALTVIGYQIWAKASRMSALLVTLVPYVTIYGIWFAFAMSKAA